MTLNKKALAVGASVAAAAVAVAGLAGVANAAGAFEDDSADQPIVGDALATASQAALNHLGEGRVTETEIEDEDSYYEVEVTLEDGSQVDVQLDEEFNVVDSAADAQNEPGDDD